MWLPEVSEAPEDRKDNPAKWLDLNPGYELIVWGTSEIRELIGDVYPSYLKIWDELDSPVKKSDLSRLLILHAFGGVYFDIDLIPVSSLDNFFEDEFVYNKYLKLTRRLPETPSIDKVDKRKYRVILSREHCAIDNIGVGVANGIIMAESDVDWIIEFVELQKNAFKGLVLDYVGTWAFTRFIRSRVSQLRSTPTLILPPHYLLWEQRFFNCPPPDYCISIHPAQNSWGDHTRSDWWRI
jgi:hypothetical protein